MDGVGCHTGSITDVDVMLAAYEGWHSLRLGTKENIHDANVGGLSFLFTRHEMKRETQYFDQKR